MRIVIAARLRFGGRNKGKCQCISLKIWLLSAARAKLKANLTMLPHFPESHKEMIELRDDQMLDAIYSASPMLSQIATRAQLEGKDSSFQDEQGKIRKIDYKKKSVTIQRRLEDAKGMTLKEFVDTAREPGKKMGEEMARGVYQSIDQATRETGNVINAKGGSFTYDLFLDGLDKVQIDFTPDGNPKWPTAHVNSAMHAELKRLLPEWEKEPAFQARMKSMVERKREEFYAREACRRLVE